MLDSIFSSIASADAAKKASADAANKDLMGTLLAIQAQKDAEQRAYDYNKPFYDPSLQAMGLLSSALYGGPQSYRAADGSTQIANYNPTESASFRYTKGRTMEDLSRQLRMMGRYNSTPGMNAMGRTLGDLTAANEGNYQNSLWNMANIGRGTGQTLSANAMQTGNTLANLFSGSGQRQAGYAYDSGMANANLYKGFGNLVNNEISRVGSIAKLAGSFYGGGQ